MKKFVCALTLLCFCLTEQVSLGEWMTASYTQHRWVVETGMTNASNPDPDNYQSLLESSWIGNIHFTDASVVAGVKGVGVGNGEGFKYSDSLLITGATSLVVHPGLYNNRSLNLHTIYTVYDLERFTWTTKTIDGVAYNPLNAIYLWGSDGTLMAELTGNITSSAAANGFTKWTMSNVGWDVDLPPMIDPGEWVISFDFNDDYDFYLNSYTIVMDNRSYDSGGVNFTTFDGNYRYAAAVQPPDNAVPEPATMLLVGLGIAGLPFLRRRAGRPLVS